MPRPGLRTKKVIKKIKKTKTGKKIHYIRKKKTKATCAICGVGLFGIKKGAKSKKTVNRKFGGELCTKCATRVIKEYTRIKEGEKTIEEVDLKYQKYVTLLK